MKKFIPELRKQADTVVVLAYLPKIKIKRFIDKIPPVDFILGADGYSYTHEPLEYKETVVIYAGSQGKALGLLSFSIEKEDPLNFSSKLIHVSYKIEQDKEVKSLLEEAIKEMKE